MAVAKPCRTKRVDLWTKVRVTGNDTIVGRDGALTEILDFENGKIILKPTLTVQRDITEDCLQDVVAGWEFRVRSDGTWRKLQTLANVLVKRNEKRTRSMRLELKQRGVGGATERVEELRREMAKKAKEFGFGALCELGAVGGSGNGVANVLTRDEDRCYRPINILPISQEGRQDDAEGGNGFQCNICGMDVMESKLESKLKKHKVHNDIKEERKSEGFPDPGMSVIE